MNKKKKETVAIILLLLLLCFFIYYVSFRPWIIANNTENDVSKYEKYIRLYKESSPKWHHFPDSVPEQSLKAIFCQHPGFLQASDILCLRLQLPKNHILNIKKSLDSSSRIILENHDKLPLSHSYPPDNFTDIKEDFKIGYLEELPDDFKIYLYKTDIEKLGNHGFVAFTAISLDKNEVLYYAESW
jgi:hypothetical protein